MRFTAFSGAALLVLASGCAAAQRPAVEISAATRQESEQYFRLLATAVRQHYEVSAPSEAAQRIRAEVAFLIGAGGELIDVSLTKPSGDEPFDSAVLGAVKKAAPFPAPPEHLRDSLKKTGVAIVFTP